MKKSVLSYRAALVAAAAVLAAGLAIATTGAAPGIYQVRVLDADGQPATGPVAVYDAAGNLLDKAAVGPDGQLSVVARPGQKLMLGSGAGTIHDRGRTVGLVVPASDSLRGAIDVRLAPTDPPQQFGGPSCDTASLDLVIGGVDIDDNSANPAPDPSAFDCGTNYDGGPGAWYRVTGNGNQLTVTTCGAATDYDTNMTVYQDCVDCASLQCIDGNDDEFGCSFSILQSQVTWCSVPGQDYLVFVHGFGGGSGTYEVSLTDTGLACAGAACPEPEGACCNCLNAPFNCTTETAGSCAAMGADYQGDDTGCAIPLGPRETFVATGTPIAIPDSPGGPVGSTIVVAPRPELVGDVDVTLEVTHTYIGDLLIDLTHDGRTVALWAGNCGSTDNLMATADDAGTETSCLAIAGGPPSAVRFNPEVGTGDMLETFEGLPMAGDWTLSVSDQFGGDTGTIDAWSLDIELAEPRCAGAASSAASVRSVASFR